MSTLGGLSTYRWLPLMGRVCLIIRDLCSLMGAGVHLQEIYNLWDLFAYGRCLNSEVRFEATLGGCAFALHCVLIWAVNLSVWIIHSWLQHMKELNSVLEKTFWWKLLLSQQVILFLFWCQMFYLKLYLMTIIIIIFIIIYLMIIMSGVSHREPKH